MTLRHLGSMLFLLVAGCGPNGSVCGNGVVETGEDCDQGALNGQPGQSCSATCKSVSTHLVQLSVTWSVDLIGKGDPIPGYTPPGCSNFGATQAHVMINGPSPSDKIVDCARYTLHYPTCLMGAGDAGETCDKMPQPGQYEATVTLLRDDGTAITNAVSTNKMTVMAGPEVSFPISFQMVDFLRQDYTGTLDFHASWGAPKATCADAKIMSESILLLDSQMKPVPGMTALGTTLDGKPGMCFTSDMITKTFEQIDNVPWGRYRLAVYSQAPSYCSSVPVFVNPGKYNTTYEILVPMLSPPPDGGVGDGGASDGGATSCP